MPYPGQRPCRPKRCWLLPCWRQMHLMWSVRFKALALAALVGWNMLPVQITDLFPGNSATLIAAALVLASFTAQFIPQPKLEAKRHGKQ